MTWREKLIEAGVIKIEEAAKAMQQSHISLIPRPTFAVTDADGIARLSVNDVMQMAFNAIVDTLESNAEEMQWRGINHENSTRRLIAALRSSEE